MEYISDEEMIQQVDDEKTFSEKLYRFMAERGSPIEKIPIFDHKELNLYQLYKGVIARGGLETVIENKLWRQITNELSVDPERTDAGFRLRIHYLKFLYPYERKFYLRLNDDDFDYEAYERQISKSHSTNRDRSVRNLPARKKKNSSSSSSSQNGALIQVNGSQTSNLFQENSNNSEGSSPSLPNEKRPHGSLTKNFKQLDYMTLKRYKKYHRLKLAGSSSKRELTEAIVQHFTLQKVDDEDTVINSFLAHVRCSKENQREREQRRRNAARKVTSSPYDDRYT